MNFLKTKLPLVAAPMAGGPSTVALARAVAAAGAFAFLAAGYKTVEAMATEITELSQHTQNFGVNLFVPGPHPFNREDYDSFRKALAEDATRFGVELPAEPRDSDDFWEEKLRYLEENPVPVVSFTFGLPSADVFERLRAVGSTTVASVTTPAEAQAAARNGAAALVVQGPRAGGHSATFTPARTIDDAPTLEILTAVREVCDLPLIAAGGVDDPSAVKELLDAGAQAVAVGTLLLRTDEAGTGATHREALANPRFTETALTSAFTGRPARALVNRYLEKHQQQAIIAYPQVHFLTQPLRKAANTAGAPEYLHCWAGTGWQAARSGPVQDTITWLTEGI